MTKHIFLDIWLSSNTFQDCNSMDYLRLNHKLLVNWFSTLNYIRHILNKTHTYGDIVTSFHILDILLLLYVKAMTCFKGIGTN